MEIYQIRSFLAVAEEASVTRAAKRIYTTPPSVSAHIKSLEEELGVRLFDRSAKGMRLTPEGLAIREKAARLLEASTEIANQAALLRGQVIGGLEVGLNSPPLFLKAPQQAAFLREKYPRLELNFVSSESDKIVDSLRTEVLDVGFIYTIKPLGDLTLIPLHKTHLKIVAPISWKDALPVEDWEALVAKPWIYTHCNCIFYTQFENQLDDRGLALKSYVRCESDEMRIELIRNGMGIGIMEDYEAAKLVKEGTGYVWQQAAPLTCDLNFAFLSRRAEEPHIVAASEAVKDAWGLE